MALKKSQIYSSLWQSCDQLRGGMDASQYKDYVLTLLFMKYVSDKNAGVPGAMIDIPAGGGFADMAKLKGDKEIGDNINKIIGKLAESNDLKGVITEADFNDKSKLDRGSEMQDKLSKLVAIFENLDFRTNRSEGDDLQAIASFVYDMETEIVSIQNLGDKMQSIKQGIMRQLLAGSLRINQPNHSIEGGQFP